MKPEKRQALVHVATVFPGVFQDVFVQVGYEHYAEARASLPAFLAVPFNSLIHLASVFLGWDWLRRDGIQDHAAEGQRASYLKDVFAAGPVQWLRTVTQTRPTAVLDQWFTLPRFGWPVAWCLYLDQGWQPWVFFSIECLSLASYCLALLHPCGFEVTLGVHILGAVEQALQTPAGAGGTPKVCRALGVLSFVGFVVLKLWDHQLTQPTFQQLTGHFWSKVCDILQFHFALFLTNVNGPQRDHPEKRL
ncbi:LOW QUALITY PROTEIN: transmembrane protein 187 [Rhynchocyon petersi]